MDIWIAFVTGLTAGGLSCIAVQGGLLASSLAAHLERDVQNHRPKPGASPPLAAPIAIFLLARLTAYSMLGLLLGSLGSTLSLTPAMRAMLQFAIGVFMIGNALRMLNVHPLFRYLTFEPPSFVTRFIRRSSKGKTGLGAPVFLGAMTVLIPCGITQGMMAVALGTADPFAGAATMFSFTLGASPSLFAVAYAAARLGAVMEKRLLQLVSLVLLILGGYAIDTGLNLIGSPFSLTNTVQGLADFANPAVSAQADDLESHFGDIVLVAKPDGYEPRTLLARADQATRLAVFTVNTRSCTNAFLIPELGIKANLPVTGKVVFDIPAQPPDKVIRFLCADGMYTGQIVFQ